MKVIFEPEDFAVVEDNTDAGELAACHIRLIKKINSKTWLARNESYSYGPPHSEQHEVEEIYLNP